MIIAQGRNQTVLRRRGPGPLKTARFPTAACTGWSAPTERGNPRFSGWRGGVYSPDEGSLDDGRAALCLKTRNVKSAVCSWPTSSGRLPRADMRRDGGTICRGRMSVYDFQSLPCACQGVRPGGRTGRCTTFQQGYAQTGVGYPGPGYRRGGVLLRRDLRRPGSRDARAGEKQAVQ